MIRARSGDEPLGLAAHVPGCQRGKLHDAELLYREVVCGQRETLGAEHTSTLAAEENLSCLLSKTGKLHGGDDAAEGSALLRDAAAT
jgi:hypothetical protein